jgi:hypothetical protein
MTSDHYTKGRQYEPLAVILDWKLPYCLGNVLKYIARYNRKPCEDPKEDLFKALDYLKREIERE